MKTKKEVPTGSKPVKDLNFIDLGVNREQSKGTKYLPLCKKSCKYSQLREKILHNLKDAHSITEIAYKYKLTYSQAYKIICELNDDGKIIMIGSQPRRKDKRITQHYQKPVYYYKQNPGERERHRLLDMQKRYWRITGEFISLQNLAQWRQSR
ncbi:hypothetical protein [Proteiniphilum saccharofermentans]|uniref:hypothetical protein n=1 Tax=Proteiniphilum saccharofermentans TaxID=1642647 RepID=UPI0028ACEE04|nr:hypothetical protein [Proteiniphilum saccharofermentans]